MTSRKLIVSFVAALAVVVRGDTPTANFAEVGPILGGNDPDTAIGPGTAQWHLSGFGNHVVGPCEDGGVFVLDSANYRIKRVQLLAEGGATASRVAGTGTKAASSSASTQGVAATSVAIGSITGFVMQPSTCDVFFTERGFNTIRRLALTSTGYQISTVYQSATSTVCEYEVFGLPLPTGVSQCNTTALLWVDGIPTTSTLLTSPTALQYDAEYDGLVFVDGVALRRATLDASSRRVTNVSTLHQPTGGWDEPTAHAAGTGWVPSDGGYADATITPFVGFSLAWEGTGALLLLDPLCGLVRRASFSGEYGLLSSLSTIVGNASTSAVVLSGQLGTASALNQDITQSTTTGDFALARAAATGAVDGIGAAAYAGFAKYILPVSNVTLVAAGLDPAASGTDYFLLAGANTYALTIDSDPQEGSSGTRQEQITEEQGDPIKSKLRVLAFTRAGSSSSTGTVETMYAPGTTSGSAAITAAAFSIEQASEVQSTHVLGMACVLDGGFLFASVGGSYFVSGREAGFTGASAGSAAGSPNGGDSGPVTIAPQRGWPLADGADAVNINACASLGCTSPLRNSANCEYQCYHPVCGDAQMTKCDEQLKLDEYTSVADVSNCFQDSGCTQTMLMNTGCDTLCDIPACNFDNGACTDASKSRAPLPVAPLPPGALPPNVNTCLGPTKCPSVMLLLDDKCHEECNIAACGDLEVLLGGCSPRSGAHLDANSNCLGSGSLDCKSMQLGDGSCDAECFTASCLFDIGDCGTLPEVVRAPEAYLLKECLGTQPNVCSSGYKLLDSTADAPDCQSSACGEFDAMSSDNSPGLSSTPLDWPACQAAGCASQSLLANNVCDMECLHPLCGPREYHFCFSQPANVFSFDASDRELCDNDKCNWILGQLGNGVCNLEQGVSGTGCDTPACNYDHGDCRDVLGLEKRVGSPTAPATQHTLWPDVEQCLSAGCDSLFTLFDDECTPACNVEDCGRGETLFGGCAANPVHWTTAEFQGTCASNGCDVTELGDGTCNAECFVPACGMDLGDCGALPYQLAEESIEPGVNLQVCIESHCDSAARLLDASADGPNGSNCRHSTCGTLDVQWSSGGPPAWMATNLPGRRSLAPDGAPDGTEEGHGDQFIPEDVLAANTTDTFIDSVLLYALSSTRSGGSGGRGGKLRLPAGSPFVRTRPQHHKGMETASDLLSNVAYPPQLLDPRRQVWFPTTPAESSARIDLFRPVASGGVWSTVSNSTMPYLPGRSKYELVAFRGELWAIGGNTEPVLDPSSYAYSARVPYVRAGNSTASVMIFNVTAGTWRAGPSLNIPREDFGVVNIEDKALLVIGGVRITAGLEQRATWSAAEGVISRQEMLASIEVLDAVNATGRQPHSSFDGAWLRGVHPDMPFARDAFGVTMVGQELWLLGGRKECDLAVAADSPEGVHRAVPIGADVAFLQDQSKQDGGDEGDNNQCFSRTSCTAQLLQNAACDAACNVPVCLYDSGSCSEPLPPGVSSAFNCMASGCENPANLYNTICDPQCNTNACGNDAGRCSTGGAAGGGGGGSGSGGGTSSCSTSCNRNTIGDGQCDVGCNLYDCGFDGGDCVEQPPAPIDNVKGCLQLGCPSISAAMSTDTCTPSCSSPACGVFMGVLCDAGSGISEPVSCTALGCTLQKLRDSTFDAECYTGVCGYAELVYGGNGQLTSYIPSLTACQANGCDLQDMLQGNSCNKCDIPQCGSICFNRRRALAESTGTFAGFQLPTTSRVQTATAGLVDDASSEWWLPRFWREEPQLTGSEFERLSRFEKGWWGADGFESETWSSDAGSSTGASLNAGACVDDDLRPYTSVDVYDISNGRWRQHGARLKVPLVRPAVVSRNGVVYAFGGERLLKFNRQQPVTVNDAVAAVQYLDTASSADSFNQLWNVDGLALDNLPELARVDFANGLLSATQEAPLPGFGEALEGVGGSSNRPRYDAVVVAGRLYTPWEFATFDGSLVSAWTEHTGSNPWSWNRIVHMAALGGSLYTLSDIPHSSIETRASWRAGHVAKYTPVTAALVVDSVSWDGASTSGGQVMNVTFSVSPAALSAAPDSLVVESTLNVTIGDSAACTLVAGSLQSIGAPVFAVQCVLPPGAGAGIAVTVSIPSGSGSLSTFSYAAPIVSGASPSLLRGSGRETVTISGSNFGPPGDSVVLQVWWERPDHAVCTRLDVASGDITHVSHSVLQVLSPAGVGTGWIPRVSAAAQVDVSGEVWYARSDWRNSNTGRITAHTNPRPAYALAYSRPTISSVTVTSDATPGVSPTVGGATLTVSASSMGVGSQRCGFAASVADAFSGGTHAVDALVLTHPAYQQRICSSASFGSGNVFGFASATCSVPAGAGSNWTVSIRVDGQFDTDTAADADPLAPTFKSSRIFSYAAPQVFATVPNENGDVVGGQTVTILGGNFGTLNYSNAAIFRTPVGRRALSTSTSVLQVYVGAFLAPSVTWVSDTSVRIVTPPGRGQLNAVVICILGQCSSSTVDSSQALNYFTFVPPQVDSAEPSFIFQGDFIGNYTIRGSRFGLQQADLTGIIIAGAACPTVQRVSAHTILCLGVSGQSVVPTGASGLVSVSVAGQSSTSSNVAPVSILREPTVVSVTPSTQAVGGRVTLVVGSIVGDATDPQVDASNTQVTIDGLQCTDLRLEQMVGLEAHVSCIVPDPGADLDTSLNVQVTSRAGLVSPPNTLFSYFGAGDPPAAPFGLSAVTVGTATPGTRTIQYQFYTVRALSSDAAVATSMDVYFSRSAAQIQSSDRATVLEASNVVHTVAALDTPPTAVSQGVAWALAQKLPALSSEVRSLLQGSAAVEVLLYTLSDSTYQGEPYYFRVGARNPAGLSGLSEAAGPVLDKCSNDQYLATESASVSDVVCKACPTGAFCGGQPAHRIVNLAGFWRTPWNALTFAECDTVEACTGYSPGDDASRFFIVPSAFGLSASAVLMGEAVNAVMVTVGNSTTFAYQNQTSAFASASDSCGAGFTGVLCNRCADGYAREGKYGCGKCGTPELNVLGLMGGSLLAVLVVGGLTFMALKAKGRPGKLPVSILKNLFTHLQVVALASAFPLQWPGTVDVMFTTLDAASSVSDQLISPDCVASGADAFSLLHGSPFYLRAVVMIALPWMIMAVLAVFWYLHYAMSCPVMWEPRTWNAVCCKKCHIAVDSDDQQSPVASAAAAEGDCAIPVKSASKHVAVGGSKASIGATSDLLDDTAGDRNPLASSESRAGSHEGLLPAMDAPAGLKQPSLAEMDDDFAASRMSSGSDEQAFAQAVKPGALALPPTAAADGANSAEAAQGGAAASAVSPGRIAEALLADEQGYNSRAADEAAAAAANQAQQRQATQARLQAAAVDGDATAAKQLQLLNAVAQSEKVMDHWGYFFVSMVVTSFLIHPSLTRTTLALFTCTSLPGSDDLFLVADKSIRCNTGESLIWQFAVGVPFFVLYAFGIPAAALYMLYRRRAELQSSVHTRAVYGFLYASFKPQYYWWEELTMLRKVLFAIMGVLLAPLGIISQVMLAILVLTAFAIAHTRAMPFGKKLLNVQEMYSLVVSLLTLQGGLYLFACESCADATRVAVTVLIVLINAGYTLMTMYFLYLAVKFGDETAKIEKAVSFTTFFAAMCRGLNRAVAGS